MSGMLAVRKRQPIGCDHANRPGDEILTGDSRQYCNPNEAADTGK